MLEYEALLCTISISHARKYCRTMSGDTEAMRPFESQASLNLIRYHIQPVSFHMDGPISPITLL